MIKTTEVPRITDPKMIDQAIEEINEVLTGNISWIDRSYGKVERLTEGKGREQKTYPAIYTGSKKNRGYLKLFPDSHIGNFSYFEITKHVPNDHYTIFEFGIVFWFSFEKVFPNDHKTKTLENVKDEVYSLLYRYGFNKCRLKIEGFVEGANNIYRGFTHKEIENQFLMRPFGGFKIEGRIRVSDNC